MMNFFISELCRLSFTLLLFFFGTKAVGQTPREVFDTYFKDWYQVEVVIFERIDNISRDPESWPKNVTLSYPANLQFLTDEITQASDTQNVEVARDNNSEFLERLKQQGNTDDPLTRRIINAIEKSEIERMTPDERPYVILPESARDLNDDARRLGRSRSMRVLFHEAWRQPFFDQESAPAIVISGGDLFSEHYELEGSVTLFLSRYLHIHTNLWLTQFEANFGQEIEHWPLLPRRPAPYQNPELPSIDVSDTTLDDARFRDTGFQDTERATWELQFNKSDGFELGQTDTGLFTDYTRLTQQPYVIRELLTMRQQRRMRSEELHYLDHPRMGLLIRIKKYIPKMP